MAKYLIEKSTLNSYAEQVQRLKANTASVTPEEQIGFLSTIATRSAASLAATGATVTVPSGYYSTQATKTVTTATRGSTILAATSVNDTADTITLTASNTQGTGYVTGSTQTSSVTAQLSVNGPTATMTIDGKSVSKTVSTKGAATYTPGTVAQTINSGVYLTGTQTISGDADLVPGNIKPNVSIFGVSGTYTNDATATAAQVLSGKTAYVKGAKITGTIPTKSSTDITVNANNVTTPSGYYASAVTKTVPAVGRAETTLAATTDTTNAKITYTASNNQATGYVTGANKTTSTTVSLSVNGPTVTASDGTRSVSRTVATAARAETTSSVTADDTSDKLAITASNNQGTGYVAGANKSTTITAALTISGPTATMTAGGKSVSATVAIAPRADTTISATSADDTNDTITVRGSNAQTTGYVYGATKTADITATLTTAGQMATMTIGDKSVSRAVASGSVSVPNTSLTSTPTISVSSSGLISVSHSSSKSVSPTLTTGWIESGTSGTFSASGSNTKQLSTQGGTTITPGTTQKTAVSSGKYTTGTVYVAGDSNLVAGNIKSGTTIFGVTGTYSGGSGGGPLVYAIDNLIRGFYKLPNNYYVSINRTNNSVSRCRIGFYVPTTQNIVISTWQESELHYDYLHFSGLDSTSEWTNCLGEISKTVIYSNVSAGTHFIEIWYKKDGSEYEGEDYGAFMINNAVCALETTLTVNDRDPLPGGGDEGSLLSYPVTDWEYGYNNGHSGTDGYSDVTNWNYSGTSTVTPPNVSNWQYPYATGTSSRGDYSDVIVWEADGNW